MLQDSDAYVDKCFLFNFNMAAMAWTEHSTMPEPKFKMGSTYHPDWGLVMSGGYNGAGVSECPGARLRNIWLNLGSAK